MGKETVEENRLRRSEYKKDIKEEMFLHSLNKYLKIRESQFMASEKRVYPNIFMFGLPRSGTTLLSQLIASCLNVGYVNNVIARFWMAPLQGIILSRILLKDVRFNSFSSTHGVTHQLTEPHEFGYFWSAWLGSGTRLRKYDEVDWQSLRRSLDQISMRFGKPVLYKNLLIGMHLEGMSQTFQDSLFIWVKRDLIDNGVSIINTRKERFGSKDYWWSLRPPGYERVVKNSCYEQVAYQIKKTNAMQTASVGKAGINPLIVDYSHLCKDPETVLLSVQDRMEKMGYQLGRIHAPPSHFQLSTYLGHPDFEPMKNALEAISNRNMGREMDNDV